MSDIAEVLAKIESELGRLNAAPSEGHRPSRFADVGASLDVVDHLAAGGGVDGKGQLVPGYKMVEKQSGRDRSRETRGLAALMTKALAEGTPSAGGYLVEREVAAEVVTMIRARSAIMRLGPTVVPVRKELALTSIASGAAAQYVAENAAIPPSEETFGQGVLLRPKELAALVPISNRLLRDAWANPDVEQVIRSDLAEILALREDLAFLQGTGTGEEPLGIKNVSGLTAAPDLGTNGAAPDFDSLKDLVANLRTANAPFQKPGWVFNPRTINTLEKIKDGQDRYLADAGLLTFDRTGGGGTLLGFPFVTSTQIPTTLDAGSNHDASYIIFSSDWQECWVGEEEALEIAASDVASYLQLDEVSGDMIAYSAFQNRQTLFRATMTHDLGLRRPQLFSVMTGVRP